MEAITSKSMARVLALTVAILLIPFVAMQFTDEVAWNVADFIVTGIILLGAGFIYELVIKKFIDAKYRAISVGILLVAVILVWAELAVGLFNTPLGGS